MVGVVKLLTPLTSVCRCLFCTKTGACSSTVGVLELLMTPRQPLWPSHLLLVFRVAYRPARTKRDVWSLASPDGNNVALFNFWLTSSYRRTFYLEVLRRAGQPVIVPQTHPASCTQAHCRPFDTVFRHAGVPTGARRRHCKRSFDECWQTLAPGPSAYERCGDSGRGSCLSAVRRWLEPDWVCNIKSASGGNRRLAQSEGKKKCIDLGM